jgi:hypothetical protein
MTLARILCWPALLLCACAAPRPDWYRDAAFAPPEVEAEWARYHWYVADVKYDFRTRDAVEEGYRGPVSYADIYLVVKALTEEGAQIGTLNIPYWNQNIHDMNVVLLDSAGTRVPLDQAAVLATYREKGAVVLPRVTRGSVVALHIRQGPFLVLDYWEYPMQGLVPTWKSRFRFSYPKRLHYAFQGYNGLGAPEADSSRADMVNMTWQSARILPLDDVPFLDPAGARPRLAITSRNGAVGQGFPDWKSVAEMRAKEHFPAPSGATGLARRLAQELTAGAQDDSAKADQLLTWVQDNVAWDPEAKPGSDADQVAEKRQGDLWQLSALLREMFAGAGLESEILLTRGRDQGGFDPDMVTPNAAWEPVVAVRAGGREWAAMPHARSYGLGDYPATLYGMQSLSLSSGICRALPAPRYPTALVATEQEARLPPARERMVTVTLDGPWAGMARTDWYEGRWPDLSAFCRSFLSDLGFTAPVLSCAESGMEARNRPLHLEVAVENGGSSVERGGARQASYPNLFTRPAWFYDSARADDYYFPFAQVRRETAVFRADPAAGAPGRPPVPMRVEAEVSCRDHADDWLEVSCVRGDAEGDPVFTRETRMDAGRFSAPELRGRQSVFRESDRIKDLRVTARPAPPTPLVMEPRRGALGKAGLSRPRK